MQRIYDVETPHDVLDYLIRDHEQIKELDAASHSHVASEKLLILPYDDTVFVGLYIESDIIDRLHKDNPFEYLHKGNLIDFFTALEGVSHFLYLTRSLQYERDVSLLELEIQAEVDKYIMAAFLLGKQYRGFVSHNLYDSLFNHSRYAHGLDYTGRKRYQDANRYAARYCRYLQHRFLRPPAQLGFMSELRRFYRLSHHQKLNRIRGLPAPRAGRP